MDTHVTDYKVEWSILHSMALPVFPASAKQAVWDAPAITANKTLVSSSYSDSYHQARLSTVSTPHNSDWLHALPISACGLRLDTEAVSHSWFETWCRPHAYVTTVHAGRWQMLESFTACHVVWPLAGWLAITRSTTSSGGPCVKLTSHPWKSHLVLSELMTDAPTGALWFLGTLAKQWHGISLFFGKRRANKVTVTTSNSGIKNCRHGKPLGGGGRRHGILGISVNPVLIGGPVAGRFITGRFITKRKKQLAVSAALSLQVLFVSVIRHK